MFLVNLFLLYLGICEGANILGNLKLRALATTNEKNLQASIIPCPTSFQLQDSKTNVFVGFHSSQNHNEPAHHHLILTSDPSRILTFSIQSPVTNDVDSCLYARPASQASSLPGGTFASRYQHNYLVHTELDCLQKCEKILESPHNYTCSARSHSILTSTSLLPVLNDSIPTHYIIQYPNTHNSMEEISKFAWWLDDEEILQGWHSPFCFWCPKREPLIFNLICK